MKIKCFGTVTQNLPPKIPFKPPTPAENRDMFEGNHVSFSCYGVLQTHYQFQWQVLNQVNGKSNIFIKHYNSFFTGQNTDTDNKYDVVFHMMIVSPQCTVGSCKGNTDSILHIEKVGFP